MANWKKVVVSGSNVSQLNNDAGYITAGTLSVPNLFSTASFNGVNLLANSISGTLNFASSSTQGLTITADAGSDTLTFGLAAIPNASLANSAITIAGTSTSLGSSITQATILAGSGVFSGSAQITGLTNANLSGTAGITNANLLNSGSIIGNTVVNLGTTVTSLTGLTSVSSTAFTGSLEGTASFTTNASTASYVTTLNQNVAISGALSVFLTGSSTFELAGNNFQQTYINTAGALVLNPGSGGVGMAGLNQYITANYFQGTTAGSYLTGSLQGTASFASTVPYSGITGVPAGLVSGSSQISYSGITGVPANIVSASVLSSPGQGQALLTTNGVAGSTIDLGLETGDSPSFAGVTAGNVTVGVSNDNTITTTTGDLTISPAGGNVTVSNNLTVTNNLTVQGTASFQNTTNLEVADRFILMASGSNTTGDGGIVVQQATQNIGEAFAWDSGVSRWGVTGSFTANEASYTPDAFMAAVTTAAGTSPAPAARYNAVGNIYVSSGDESIWIYS